jgi:hypothetical protein
MSGRIGFAGIALVPIACCALLPVLAAAGVGVAVGVAAGGLGLAAVALLVTSHLITRPKPKEAAVAHNCCTDTCTEGPVRGEYGRPLVEILYFDGCPNHESARALVERVSRDIGVEPELRLVNVLDEEAARRLRFLGSPTIRVAGTDVDPNAGERDDYVLSCRVYQTDRGFAGQPDEASVREALERAASNDAGAASKST